MPEVKVIDEDLSGLGWTLKSLIDDNFARPGVWESVRRINGSLVITETGADVSSTLFFKKGELSIQNGAVKKSSARMAAGFDELAAISSGQLGPIWALLSGKIKAGGNLLKLLLMARAIISKEK